MINYVSLILLNIAYIFTIIGYMMNDLTKLRMFGLLADAFFYAWCILFLNRQDGLTNICYRFIFTVIDICYLSKLCYKKYIEKEKPKGVTHA